jgi:hypothetical protein
MRLLTRGRVITLILVGAFLAVNVAALRWSTGFFSGNAQPATLLKYGDHVPEFATSNPINLVLYFSLSQAPGYSTELVKYAETLSQRYKKDGLGITVVVQQNIPDLRTMIDQQLITYNVIVDDKWEIQDRLGLTSGEEGVFLFNKEGQCLFSTRRQVSAGDLRQLVAVELLKVDPFTVSATESTPVLRPGSSLNSLSLLEARSMAPASIESIRAKAGVPSYYVFLTADCSLCSLPTYMQEFKSFRINHLQNDHDAVLFFDFNFPRADVLRELKTYDIQSPVYLAKEPLPGIEFTDQQYRILERTVAIVQTDAQRKVLNIFPLNSYVTDGNKAARKPQTQPVSTGGPAYEEMFSYVPFTAYDVATYQGKYFLTDFEGNRIIVINDKMEVERDFGRIGSGPGRVFHPGYLDISRDGTIFVEDGGNERIVKFDQAGKYLGDFRVSAYQGLAAGAQGELYLGQPEEGHLITVYSSAGKKLRSFGELKKFSDFHGDAPSDQDEAYKLAFNRVRLTTDKDDNLYVSFMLTPLIQKYSPDGKLLFERRLAAPEIDRLLEAIQKKRHISTRSDGVDARIIALDPVIDPANGNIMVPLVDASIYVADREGNKVALLQPKGINRGDGSFYPFVAGLGAKGEFMVTPFPPKRWYRLSMNDKTSNASATVAAR